MHTVPALRLALAVALALLVVSAPAIGAEVSAAKTQRGALAINAENYEDAMRLLMQARQLEGALEGVVENLCRAAYNVQDHAIVMQACAEVPYIRKPLETVLLGRSVAQADGAEVAHMLLVEIMRQSQVGAIKFSCELAVHVYVKRLGFALDTGKYNDAEQSARALHELLHVSMFGSTEQATIDLCTQSSFHWNQYYEPSEWDVLDHKDVQLQALRKQAARLGAEHFSFFPPTFSLPAESNAFLAHHEAEKAARGGVPPFWIYKPVFGHGGIGVFVNTDPVGTVANMTEEMVVQRYIEKPHLLHGRKYHMRYYVAIMSNSPLRLYFHRVALAKISASPHSLAEEDGAIDNCVTVSNTGTCKNEHFSLAEDMSKDGTGNVWTTTALYKHMEAEGIDTKVLHGRVMDIAAKCVIAGQDYIIKPSHNVSQASVGPKIMGLDITFDEDANPYMLELEKGPGLGGGKSAVDDFAKVSVVRDLYDMLIHKSFVKNRERLLRQVATTLATVGLRVEHSCSGGSHLVSCFTPHDLRHLIDYELEQEKMGGYELLFPHPRTMAHFFEHFDENDVYSRQQNALMHRYLHAKLVVEPLK